MGVVSTILENEKEVARQWDSFAHPESRDAQLRRRSTVCRGKEEGEGSRP